MNSLKQLTTLTNRIIKQNFTNADTIITVILMPVFMLLFFVYVMGGNIVTGGNAPSTAEYLKYSMPGFLLLTMATGSAYTALRINMDQTSGFLNRLHSLPIKRWVILGSHVVASVIFMLLAEIAVLLVGMLMGFRIDADLMSVLGFFGISILFSFAITLLAIPFSLKAKSYASAGGFSYILMLLLFLSSALMPTTGMAKPIQIFADHQPMTPIVNSARMLLNGIADPANNTMLISLSWLVGLVLVFGALSLYVYRVVFNKK